MKFAPTGKLFRFISSSEEEKKHILKTNEESCKKREMQIQSWIWSTPSDNYTKVETLMDKYPGEIRCDKMFDLYYYNYVNGYDDEFFRLLDLEDKMCEGLSEAEDPNSDDNDEEDHEK
tara:strand:+ start:485 stop:838 length:354 start_codon:yes stop_codon:yes gene_type:complete